MSEDTSVTTTAASPARNLLAQAALLAALVALLFSLWQWWDQRRQEVRLQQALTDKISQFDERSRETALLAKHAEDLATRYTAKIGLLEEKLQIFSAQQEALQTLYLELAGRRSEYAVAEAEHLLIIASQQLQLAGNIRPALLALQMADSRLQQLDDPQIIPLRKAIGQDIQRLQAVPLVDTVGISLKLSTLAENIDQLPLLSERHPQEQVQTVARPDDGLWQRLVREIWQDLRRTVRIERIDQPEPPLLSPEQNYFLRENLRLRLLTARLALLQREETSYRADLRQAEQWLRRYFDTQDAATRAALVSLQQLAASSIAIEIPDISASLNAISRYKLAQEKASS